VLGIKPTPVSIYRKRFRHVLKPEDSNYVKFGMAYALTYSHN
jgi:hypothetical protein